MQSTRKILREHNPLIHCITNPISINQCANAILAVGARPMMAEHPDEVKEITATAGALLLNLGNITDARLQSIRIAAEVAAAHKIPVVLDLVGVACSSLRRSFAHTLLKQYTPQIIKGNASEIHALYDANYKSAGVDSSTDLNIKKTKKIAISLAKQYNTIILVSGKTDIITDGKAVICMQNGTPQLASVTGTGCMLGALCACYASVADGMSAAKTACAVLGISGQLSKTDKGNGSFIQNLIDKLCTLTETEINQYIKMEELQIENL